MKQLEGKRFGRLLVVSEADRQYTPKGKCQRVLNCLCDCGKHKSVSYGALVSKATRSCGCLMRESARQTGRKSATHGMSESPIFKIWTHMIQRCTNPKNIGYKNYGGRGIKVCKRWMKFENFYKDMGDRPSKKHSIDRIDNDDDYDPSNCKWSTRREQCSNKSNNHLVTYRGQTKCLTEWSRILGVNRVTLRHRLFVQGISVESAFNKPLWHKGEL